MLVLEEDGPVVRAVVTADGEVTVQQRPSPERPAPSSVIEQVLRTERRS